MKILDLVLKKQYFELIKNGDKREEYREIKPYWIKRLFEVINDKHQYEKIDNKCADFYCNPDNIDILFMDFANFDIKFKEFTHIKFRNGYTNDFIIYRIENFKIGKGKQEWGGGDKICFIIKFAEKSLKEEFAPLFDNVIQEHLSEYYIDEKIKAII